MAGATLADDDMRRLVDCCRDVRRQASPDGGDFGGWTRLLANVGPASGDRGRVLPSGTGRLLFGKRPHRYLPQAGISTVAFAGTEED